MYGSNRATKGVLHRSAGFTLLEMMVVVMIIGLLAAMVVPNLISSKSKANQKKATADIVAIEGALDMYYLDHNGFPSEQDGLQVLVSSRTSDDISGYIRHVPKDPWGRNYIYRNPGEHGRVDVSTLGEDGLPGGTGAAADIGNWNVNDF